MIETKTVVLKNDVHIRLCRIQLDLREIGIKETIQNICDVAIKDGINNTFELIKQDKTFLKNYEKSIEKVSSEA